MIFENIDKVYKNGGDLAARGQMMLAGLADVIHVSKPDRSNPEKAAAFIEAIRHFNRAYGINTTIPELKEADFGEIAESIHRECILYPVPKIMDDKDIFRLLGMLNFSSTVVCRVVIVSCCNNSIAL